MPDDRYDASVGSVTGGGERNVGVNICTFAVTARRLGRGARSSRISRRRNDDVRIALIGERPLRDAQRAVLERIEAGRNTLAVLGTGRGKSLCFQLPAAQRALASGAKTLVFYPLRALTNDQHEALVRRLARFGLRILRANGSDRRRGAQPRSKRRSKTEVGTSSRHAGIRDVPPRAVRAPA